MNEFKIVKDIKNFIDSLDDLVLVIPNRDRILKDRIYNTSYDLLYNIYEANYAREKKEKLINSLSLINMIDFYLERSYKKKYITSKLCEKKSNELLRITKMIYGLIKYESKC